ncbi:MAG: hypothetical protein ABSA74_03750 [Candidatus Staskawiczbacteria bacterium]|jgi:hypothetical protein
MTIGYYILAVINFLSYPEWHLVVFYVILLLITAWVLYDRWINKGES